MLFNASTQDQRAITDALEELDGELATDLEAVLEKWDKHIEKLKSQLGVANARLEVGRMAKVEIPKLQ